MGIKEIGEYIITETIYESNVKALYKAVSTKNDRYYIIKEYKGEGFSEQLKREAARTAEIEKFAEKTVVIPIVETIEDKYLVMEYKHQGIFLSEYMSIDVGENSEDSNLFNLYIIREILESLKVLHTSGEKGYVHFDIHPGNIFLENIDMNEKRIGVVRFLDFGEAQPLGENISSRESRGYLEVNLHYAAPEVVQNRIRKASVQSDIYSVAVIAKELLKPADKVMKCFVERFLKPGLMSSKDYRYSSCEEMLSHLETVIIAQAASIEKNYYDVLSLGYEYMIPIERLVFNKDIDGMQLEASLSELENDLITYQPDPERSLYIFEGLKKIADSFADLPKDITNRLYIAGMACYNHTGNALSAVKQYEKIDTGSMELMDMVHLNGRIAVSYADICDFDKALKVMDSSISQMKTLADSMMLTSKLAGARYSGLKELGRAYSAKGTYIQSAGSEENPEVYFRYALREFEADEGNTEITKNHILQYAAVSQNRDLYEEFEDDIFGNGAGEYIRDLEGCIYNREKEDNIDLFRLLTALKALYYIGSDSYISDKLAVLIKDTIDAITKCGRSMNRHPIQLIWKYLGLLSTDQNIKKQCFENAVDYIPGAEPEKYNRFNIITAINYKTLWIYNHMIGQEDECERLISTAINHAERDGYTIFAEQLKSKGMEGVLLGEYE